MSVYILTRLPLALTLTTQVSQEISTLQCISSGSNLPVGEFACWWFLCPGVKLRSYLIHPFYTCMSKFSTHTHTQAHTEKTSQKAEIHTPPLTHHSAIPTPLCHVFDHGSQWRVWRVLRTPSPAVARPSAITCGWHGHRQLPALPWAPPQLQDVCGACTRTFDCVLTSCVRSPLLIPSSIFVHLWHCLLLKFITMCSWLIYQASVIN